ncbi:thymidylate synthase [archaeon]|jgi:thymidylate synthase|nr:thymidylate synthase [archaeon]
MESYKKVLRTILDKGERKQNRTGIDTISISGHMFEHDMSEGFPLLTTKKMYHKGFLGETEFFIKGITDKNWLRDQGIHIWSDWANNLVLNRKYGKSEEVEYNLTKTYNEFKVNVPEESHHKRFHYLTDKLSDYFEEIVGGFKLKKELTFEDREEIFVKKDEQGKTLFERFINYAERDLGPVYGFQWRHFGAEYEGFDKDYSGKGIDQLESVVKKLKTNPTDRRMIVSAWNPVAINEGSMALPPCHYAFQVLVNPETNKLDLLWNQRSVDTFLGLPFNIGGYATMLHLLAKEGGFEEGKLRGFLADVHLYENHLEQVEEQLKREPMELPQLITENFNSIFDWKWTDSKIEGYNSHPALAAKVAM